MMHEWSLRFPNKLFYHQMKAWQVMSISQMQANLHLHAENSPNVGLWIFNGLKTNGTDMSNDLAYAKNRLCYVRYYWSFLCMKVFSWGMCCTKHSYWLLNRFNTRRKLYVEFRCCHWFNCMPCDVIARTLVWREPVFLMHKSVHVYFIESAQLGGNTRTQLHFSPPFYANPTNEGRHAVIYNFCRQFRFKSGLEVFGMHAAMRTSIGEETQRDDGEIRKPFLTSSWHIECSLHAISTFKLSEPNWESHMPNFDSVVAFLNAIQCLFGKLGKVAKFTFFNISSRRSMRKALCR